MYIYTAEMLALIRAFGSIDANSSICNMSHHLLQVGYQIHARTQQYPSLFRLIWYCPGRFLMGTMIVRDLAVEGHVQSAGV
jgi:hypothetical protein